MATHPATKWKDHLLKTSLPLEHIVAQLLEKSEFEIAGEYAYNRPNEHDQETQFSVDIHCYNLIFKGKHGWGMLNLLVECKYCYPGVQWIFAPHPKESTISALPCHISLDELSNRHLTNRGGLISFTIKVPHCTRGISLSKEGADPNSISHGLNQLRYAIPNLMADEYEFQVSTTEDKYLWASLICPILVTTATLHVLKFDVDLKDFHSASSIEEVSDEVPYLVVHQRPSPHLRQYSQGIARILQENPDVQVRFEEVNKRLAENSLLGMPSQITFDEKFKDAGYNILIVTLDALDELILAVQTTADRAGSDVKKIGTLRLEKTEKKTHLMPIRK